VLALVLVLVLLVLTLAPVLVIGGAGVVVRLVVGGDVVLDEVEAIQAAS
jgi:hypothetical protein